MSIDNHDVGTATDPSDVTLAGERGYQIGLEVLRISAGISIAGQNAPEVGRRSDGMLRLKVTPATLRCLSA